MLEKDVEWSIRELIYRNHEVGMTITNKDMLESLAKNYQEYRESNTDELLHLTDTILMHLANRKILALTQDQDKEYSITSIPTRYQCIECSQISYIGEQEERKCFSCESENLRERNVR